VLVADLPRGPPFLLPSILSPSQARASPIQARKPFSPSWPRADQIQLGEKASRLNPRDPRRALVRQAALELCQAAFHPSRVPQRGMDDCHGMLDCHRVMEASRSTSGSLSRPAPSALALTGTARAVSAALLLVILNRGVCEARADDGASAAPGAPGVVRYERLFDHDEEEGAFAVIASPGGGYMLGGYALVGGEPNLAGGLLVLDPDGGFGSFTRVSGPIVSEFYDLAPRPEGGAVLVGETLEPDQRGYVAFVDADGTLGSARSFEPGLLLSTVEVHRRRPNRRQAGATRKQSPSALVRKLSQE